MELEERLVAARTGLASARERREFMQEEAEQVRNAFTPRPVACTATLEYVVRSI